MTIFADRLPPTNRRRHAFTITEMLVVIGIIVLLLGMLFPAIHRIRISGYTADTEQELSQLNTAINEYYAVFHAYPGPFSNDQIEDPNTTVTTPLGVPGGISNFELYSYNGTTNAYTYGTPATTPWTVTGTENLVLGLLGGLRLDTSVTPPNPAFAPTEVGLGPMSLNPANPRRYSPFIDTRYIVWCSGTSTSFNQSNLMPATPTPFFDQAGTSGNDTPIPEFVDRFPNPMPILYLRARTGAHGVVSDGITMDGINATTPAAYQYDIRDIYGYVGYLGAPLNLGLPHGKFHNLAEIETVPTTWPPSEAAKAGVNSTPDAFSYFANFGYTPTSVTSPTVTNYYARPRAVDQFILISAGPDGIYGTQDDITSFGNVAQ
jgi:type II secretory pathway pseudopilin PulG